MDTIQRLFKICNYKHQSERGNMEIHLASTCISRLVLICFLISILSDNTIISVKASNDLIDSICKKTGNPQCSEILNSDQRASQASSPRALGEAVLEMGIECSASTFMLLQKLKLIGLRPRYEECWMQYGSILNHLKMAKENLASDDLVGAHKNVRIAQFDLNTCRKQFRRPPTEMKKLKEENDKLRCLCSVSLVILEASVKK